MCLLGLGSYCIVYFVQWNIVGISSIVKVAKKKMKSKQLEKRTSSNILQGVDEDTWWLGHVQKMHRRVGSRWGVSLQPMTSTIDQPFQERKHPPNLLQWFFWIGFPKLMAIWSLSTIIVIQNGWILVQLSLLLFCLINLAQNCII